MPTHFIYPIYAGLLALLTFIVVPRKEIHRLSFYAIVFGGVFDVLAVGFYSKIGMVDWVNYKPFGAFGIPFFVPLSWIAYFTIFLHFMPQNKPRKYIYPLITSGFSLQFAYVLQELGIFQWHYSPLLLLGMVYLPWQYSVAWLYWRLEAGTKTRGLPKHYFTVPKPAMKKQEKRKVRFVKPKKL